MRRTIVLLVLVGVVGLIAAFYSFNNYIYQEKQGTGEIAEPYRATLSGEYVCLPHKGDGPVQTLECAFGIRTDVGEYYAINFHLMSQTHDPVKIGQRLSASGVVHPIERLSTDQWQKYDIEGIFSVTNSLEVTE